MIAEARRGPWAFLRAVRIARPVPTVDQATDELAAATMLGGSALFLNVEGGQAERVTNRVGVDAAVVIRLEVIP